MMTMTTFQWIKEVLDGTNPKVLKVYASVLPYIVLSGTCWYAALGNFIKDQAYNIYNRISSS